MYGYVCLDITDLFRSTLLHRRDCISFFLYLMIQFSLVTQSCPALSTPWTAACQASLSPTQTNVHPVGDAMQPPHPLSFPSAAFNLSQH